MKCLGAGATNSQLTQLPISGIIGVIVSLLDCESVAFAATLGRSMPFVSKAQRGYMYANHPEMAKRWEEHTPKGKKLPRKVKKMKNKRKKKASVTLGNSQTHGTGLFAAADIASGDPIARAMLSKKGEDAQTRYEITKATRYTNHSQDPSARLVKVGKDVYLVASQAIKAGSEIFVDYRKTASVLGPGSYLTYLGEKRATWEDLEKQAGLRDRVMGWLSRGRSPKRMLTGGWRHGQQGIKATPEGGLGALYQTGRGIGSAQRYAEANPYKTIAGVTGGTYLGGQAIRGMSSGGEEPKAKAKAKADAKPSTATPPPKDLKPPAGLQTMPDVKPGRGFMDHWNELPTAAKWGIGGGGGLLAAMALYNLMNRDDDEKRSSDNEDISSQALAKMVELSHIDFEGGIKKSGSDDLAKAVNRVIGQRSHLLVKEAWVHFLDRCATQIPWDKQASVRAMQLVISSGGDIRQAIKEAHPHASGEDRGVLRYKLTRALATDVKAANEMMADPMVQTPQTFSGSVSSAGPKLQSMGGPPSLSKQASLSRSVSLINKRANVDAVKKNLASGMSPEQAVRSAYPDWDDKQVHSAISGGGYGKASATQKQAANMRVWLKRALKKMGAQDNSVLSRSAVGDPNGLSFADAGPKVSGREAWDLAKWSRSDSGASSSYWK